MVYLRADPLNGRHKFRHLEHNHWKGTLRADSGLSPVVRIEGKVNVTGAKTRIEPYGDSQWHSIEPKRAEIELLCIEQCTRSRLTTLSTVEGERREREKR